MPFVLAWGVLDYWLLVFAWIYWLRQFEIRGAVFRFYLRW
jgi:hypothetical protein